MDNLSPGTSGTAPAVNPPDNGISGAALRKTGKSGRRKVRSTAPEQQPALILKSINAERSALKKFLKIDFSTHNPGAPMGQEKLPPDLDTAQLLAHIKKLDGLHQHCLKVSSTCLNPGLRIHLANAMIDYESFRKALFKITRAGSDVISLRIARELYSVPSESDDDGKSVSENMTDEIARGLLDELNRADKPEEYICFFHKVFKCFSFYVDPKVNSLKKNDQSGLKLFCKWCELFARSLAKVVEHCQKLDSPVLNSVQKIMAVFDKVTHGQNNSLHLLAVLKQLDKHTVLDPKTSFTGKEIFAGHVIRACVAQLRNLNNIIASKVRDGDPYRLELLQKDSLVSQLNALGPYFPAGDLYFKFIISLVVDHVDHNWFALLYALAHCPAEALSGHWREKFSQQLEQYHPAARTMLDALLTASHGQLPEATNYTLWWFKAFILNKQGEHRGAFAAISQSESDCRMPGQKQPDVRLQLEILRIKMQSQQLATDLPRLSPEQLKTMKEQADNLMSQPRAFWTQDELAVLQQLRAELAVLLAQHTPAVTSVPASAPTIEDAPEKPDTEANVVMPTLPQSQGTRVKALCKNLMAEIRGWQGGNRPEPLTPDDSYQVMGPCGKALSATETMQMDYWNTGIHQLLARVSAHRADGDIIRELACYQTILGDATRKGTIGIYRLTLELTWTIMRYVNGEHEVDHLTNNEKGELLDLSWQFLKQSVCLAMRRSSPLPEQASDQELVDTVVQWLHSLKHPQATKEMEFFMRCALGSTAGHIHGFLAEIFPGQKQHADSARLFFKAKSRLQPDYQKPVCEEDRNIRLKLMGQDQQDRWIRGY
ncbi:hypothetical protein [Endozoicomonas sp. ONNA2]|uniref:hypothetical protein n=1 Tax=Endozoicomonas sp. ONNA2 TaxID=2828741 RepID=UPI0021484D7A|nr:hypothetical protein [Endozoicomonas sp. ONNA2]